MMTAASSNCCSSRCTSSTTPGRWRSPAASTSCGRSKPRRSCRTCPRCGDTPTNWVEFKRIKNGDHINIALLFPVQNLLPLHVAEFYLKAESGVEDLFAERRGNAGVLFASIPNFTEFYSEDVNEVQSLNFNIECIDVNVD